MFELNKKVEDALWKIQFIERYEALSNLYNRERTSSDESLQYVDREEVIETIQDLGYRSKFDTREKFYKLEEETVGDYCFGFHIILYAGTVDMIWVVRERGELLLGAPWGTYAKRMKDSSYIIKKPVVADYDDLEDVLKTAFSMFEDFKAAIVEGGHTEESSTS